MKPVKTHKLLSAACALSLAMGVAGGAHAKHEGVPHEKGGKKGPQLSIDVEVFCGYPAMVPTMAEDGSVTYEVMQTNAAVRVTDVSDDDKVEDPQVKVHIMCNVVEDGPGKPEYILFDEKYFPLQTVEDNYVFMHNCNLDDERVPDNATEWKVTAVVTGEQLRRDVFDSCEEIPVP